MFCFEIPSHAEQWIFLDLTKFGMKRQLYQNVLSRNCVAFSILLSICKRLGSLIVKVEFLGGRLILSNKINDFLQVSDQTIDIRIGLEVP